MPNEPPTVFGQHPHLVLLEPEVLGKNVLRHVGRLRALIDGEPLVARIPVGDDGARLVGDAGVAAEHEGRRNDRVGFGKAFIRIARGECALEGEVVAELGVDDRRSFVERCFGVGDDGKFLVVDLNQRAGILGERPRAGDHGGDRLALPARALDRDGVLRRRFDALEMGEDADPGRDHLGKLGAGDDGDHTLHALCSRGVDRLDARMRVRRAHERDMRHARQRNVADVLPAPLRQPRQIRPRHRAADIGVRPVEGGQAGGDVVNDFHGDVPLAPARSCATASMASTID